MTKHTPNPKCECDHCYVDDLNAVLRRFVEQREKGKVPVDPDAEQLAAAFELMPKYRCRRAG